MPVPISREELDAARRYRLPELVVSPEEHGWIRWYEPRPGSMVYRRGDRVLVVSGRGRNVAAMSVWAWIS